MTKLILANRFGISEFIVDYIDIASNAIIRLDGSQNNTTCYQTNKIHLKNPTYIIIANMVLSKIYEDGL